MKINKLTESIQYTPSDQIEVLYRSILNALNEDDECRNYWINWMAPAKDLGRIELVRREPQTKFKYESIDYTATAEIYNFRFNFQSIYLNSATDFDLTKPISSPANTTSKVYAYRLDSPMFKAAYSCFTDAGKVTELTKRAAEYAVNRFRLDEVAAGSFGAELEQVDLLNDVSLEIDNDTKVATPHVDNNTGNIDGQIIVSVLQYVDIVSVDTGKGEIISHKLEDDMVIPDSIELAPRRGQLTTNTIERHRDPDFSWVYVGAPGGGCDFAEMVVDALKDKTLDLKNDAHLLQMLLRSQVYSNVINNGLTFNFEVIRDISYDKVGADHEDAGGKLIRNRYIIDRDVLFATGNTISAYDDCAFLKALGYPLIKLANSVKGDEEISQDLINTISNVFLIGPEQDYSIPEDISLDFINFLKTYRVANDATKEEALQKLEKKLKNTEYELSYETLHEHKNLTGVGLDDQLKSFIETYTEKMLNKNIPAEDRWIFKYLKIVDTDI